MSLLTRLAARILSRRAHVTSHDRIIQRTKALRAELGLGEDARLA